MIKTLKQHQFLFRELVKRDFRQKYKKTTLGVIWSILNPLAEFLVLMLIFKNIFSRNTPHYTIYMLVGILNYTYFNNATHTGMQSFLNNAGIIQNQSSDLDFPAFQKRICSIQLLHYAGTADSLHDL